MSLSLAVEVIAFETSILAAVFVLDLQIKNTQETFLYSLFLKLD